MSCFNGKKFLVTGASSGIGREICIHLSELGANIVLVARDETRLKETLSLMNNPDKHRYFVYDLENVKDIHNLVNSSFEFDGIKFDGLVYAAGVPAVYPIKVLDYEKLDTTFKINTFSYLELIRQFSKKQISNDYASVVFLSSFLVHNNRAKGQLAYIMSKSASQSLAKTLSLEFLKRKIRINSVIIGAVLTKMVEQTESIRFFQDENTQKENSSDIIKILTTREVSNMVIFLLSDSAKYIVGENYFIDGGSFL